MAQIGQRLGIDDVIAVAGAQQLEEIAAALRSGGAEPSEMRIADLGAEAVRGLVARAGVVHRDPGGVRKPGTEHIASLVQKAVLTVLQQTHELPLGNHDAECLQQPQQPRYRDLPLMVLSEHEAAQFRPEMPAEAGRQRRGQHFAVRLLPALALEIHHQRTDRQVLYDETRATLEA